MLRQDDLFADVDPSDAIKIVPILIGSISSSKEAHYGQLLAPYLADSETFFVVSSDFCHW